MVFLLYAFLLLTGVTYGAMGTVLLLGYTYQRFWGRLALFVLAPITVPTILFGMLALHLLGRRLRLVRPEKTYLFEDAY
jgi:hypothetical protein